MTCDPVPILRLFTAGSGRSFQFMDLLNFLNIQRV